MVKEKINTDYIVLDYEKYPNELWCKHCDQRQVMPTASIPLSMYVAFTKEFVKIHKRCLIGDDIPFPKKPITSKAQRTPEDRYFRMMSGRDDEGIDY